MKSCENEVESENMESVGVKHKCMCCCQKCRYIASLISRPAASPKAKDNRPSHIDVSLVCVKKDRAYPITYSGTEAI